MFVEHVAILVGIATATYKRGRVRGELWESSGQDLLSSEFSSAYLV